MTSQWLIRNKLGDGRRVGTLTLYWEVEGDPISDDLTPDEIGSLELFRRWRQRYSDDVQKISWFVQGAQTHEFAPFQGEQDWLTHYYWPVNADTGERANFLQLPVVDKLWRPGRADKGGFIQEALGWKPSPFQASADFAVLSRAAGLP